LKGDTCFEWDDSGKRTFQHIKEAIIVAPVLVSPYFTKDFIIFSFSSNDTITGVLLQKNDEGDENLIAFMRKVLKDS
jgi:hypothetical protein